MTGEHISTIRLYSAIHIGSHWKIQDRRQINKLSKTQKKQTTQNTAKHPGSVAFYDTQPGNKVGLFYNAPEPTWGKHYW